jgi:hypothetical protein
MVIIGKKEAVPPPNGTPTRDMTSSSRRNTILERMASGPGGVRIVIQTRMIKVRTPARKEIIEREVGCIFFQRSSNYPGAI